MGRGAEREQLFEALGRASEASSVSVITGDAGIGKSALLEEAFAYSALADLLSALPDAAFDDCPTVRTGMAPSHFLAELYAPASTAEYAELVVSALRAQSRWMPALHLVDATFVPSDGMLLCSISAETQDAVVELGRLAGVAFDRVSPAIALRRHGRD